MIHRNLRAVALAALLLASISQDACSWHGRKKGCRERDVAAGAINRAPLKVPAGVDAPDTRNAVQVPSLAEPEKPRAPTDPCLSSPPSYKG